MAEDIKQDIEYGSDSIRTLDWKEHIRRRPGMYIGKLGDGTHADDGIYVLLKEVIDNAIDEFMMGYGKQVIIDIEQFHCTVDLKRTNQRHIWVELPDEVTRCRFFNVF